MNLVSGKLVTDRSHAVSMAQARLSTPEMGAALNSEGKKAAFAVESCFPKISQIDAAVKKEGRLLCAGAAITDAGVGIAVSGNNGKQAIADGVNE